ncbi:MAG: hypothetical protein A2X86_20405 [Bdellovibrionales bacterium GWA2_49_15]|nr:MAG: hypothetical protein A2X86_20405 [Bdellovibrionales bacterium GWA2_49_15]HAZ11323.1 hypothetical protein [Bdellovibrionales bacterium]
MIHRLFIIGLGIIFFQIEMASSATLSPYGPSIKQICSDAKNLKKIETLGELRDTIVETCQQYVATESANRIHPLVRNVIDILGTLPENLSTDDDIFYVDPKRKAEKEKLKNALDRLASAIMIEKRKSSNQAVPGPLRVRLHDLMDRFGKESAKAREAKARNLDEYRQRYLTAMIDTLKLTAEGRKAVDCWQNFRDDPFVGAEFVAPPPGAVGGITAMFVARDAKNSSTLPLIQEEKYFTPPNDGKRRYIKRIIFNPDSDPIEVLHTLEHEMQHSCSVKEDTKLRDAYLDQENIVRRRQETCCPDNNITPACAACFQAEEAKLDQIKRARDQDAIVDECRAYSSQVQFYKEMAQADPGLVCNYHYSSTAFSNQVISSAQFQSATEKMLTEGTFALLMGRDYSMTKGSTLLPQNLFLDFARGGPPPTQLRPELILKLRAAGCPLAR